MNSSDYMTLTHLTLNYITTDRICKMQGKGLRTSLPQGVKLRPDTMHHVNVVLAERDRSFWIRQTLF